MNLILASNHPRCVYNCAWISSFYFQVSISGSDHSRIIILVATNGDSSLKPRHSFYPKQPCGSTTFPKRKLSRIFFKQAPPFFSWHHLLCPEILNLILYPARRTLFTFAWFYICSFRHKVSGNPRYKPPLTNLSFYRSIDHGKQPRRSLTCQLQPCVLMCYMMTSDIDCMYENLGAKADMHLTYSEW